MPKEKKEQETEEESAVFNMAVDTLKRLGKILEEIKRLTYRTDLSFELKQSMKIELVKSFFINASPLLPDSDIKKYKKIVLSLKMKIIRATKKQGYHQSEKQKMKFAYDRELEDQLDEILIDIQIILQKEKYFMPSTEDEGDF